MVQIAEASGMGRHKLLKRRKGTAEKCKFQQSLLVLNCLQKLSDIKQSSSDGRCILTVYSHQDGFF